ncbi:MAG: TolC family protein [Chlorobiaceae bacterium]|nr:TolC family protein [Chlorobiaceae bacterium]
MARKIVFLFFTLIFLPLSVTQADNVPVKTLSLKECISIALLNSSSVLKAGNLRHLEGVDLMKSYGSFLPKVTSSARWTPTSVNRGYTTSSPLTPGASTDAFRTRTESATFDFTLTTSLNLFNGLSDYAALQTALDLKKASDYSLQRAREAVAFDVTQWYYQVLLDQELLGIAKENFGSARDLLALTDRQFSGGLKSITDLYQQQAEVSNNDLGVIKAETQLRRSRLELVRRLRIAPETELTLEPADLASIQTPPADPDIDLLVVSSLKKRADLEASALQSDASRWDVRRVAGNRLPKIDLVFSVSTDAIDSYNMTLSGIRYDYPYPSVNRQLENGMDYAISLNLSWTIFDGFMTRHSVETAKVARMNKRLDHEELMNGIAIDLRQAIGDYQAAFSRIDSARESLKAARAAYDGVLRKYELGASGFVELSVSRTALFNSRSAVTQAVYNLALQKALLDFTSGQTAIGLTDNVSPF